MKIREKVSYKRELERDVTELLNIHGVSGDERAVRNYLKPILENIMDTVEVDFYGNLLGEMKVGSGVGKTILLSAHMDTVRGVLAHRELVKSNEYIWSDVGALGADDRAGIAIILSVLRDVKNTDFEGIIKVAFSREEEIGCVGASKISRDWTKGTDLAIVVDRRGNDDIVVGCGGAFCSNEVGHFLEDVADLIGQEWHCVEGGISDAMIFSSDGINSVNLSTGYYHEHTSNEYLSLYDMTNTTIYILGILDISHMNSYDFGEVPETNMWVKDSWMNYYLGRSNSISDYSYDIYEYGHEDSSVEYGHAYGQSADEFVWASEKSTKANGEVLVYEYGDAIVVSQSDNEVILSRTEFSSILRQLEKFDI